MRCITSVTLDRFSKCPASAEWSMADPNGRPIDGTSSRVSAATVHAVLQGPRDMVFTLMLCGRIGPLCLPDGEPGFKTFKLDTSGNWPDVTFDNISQKEPEGGWNDRPAM